MKLLKFKYACLSLVAFFAVANAMSTDVLSTDSMSPTTTGFSFIDSSGRETEIPEPFITSCSQMTTPDTNTSPITVTKEIPVPGTDSVIRLTHTCRNSKTVIVLGSLFPDKQDRWKNKVRQLSPYDVITFDYAWKFASIHPQQNLVSDRYKDVIAAVEYLRTLEPAYTNIIGLGACYSAFTFTAAQADYLSKKSRPLFDKLIIDSMFDSLLTLALSVAADPSLQCNNDTGCLPDWLKWIFRTLRPDWLLKRIVPEVSMIPHLQAISDTTPILFIHGQKDLLIPIERFRFIWNTVHKDKSVAFVTPYSHVRNMRYNWNVYKAVCDCFINAPQGTEKIALKQLLQLQ